MLGRLKNIYHGFLIGVFVLSIFVVYVLKSNNIWMNIDLITDYNLILDVGKYPDNNKLKTILPKEIFSNNVNFEEDIQKALNYVSTVVDGRYISNKNLTGYQKLNNILTKKNGGICGDLAIILKEVLIAKGYKARTVQLIRQFGTLEDTHVITEVYDIKLEKFIMLDPMFNLMIKFDNVYMNANELRDNYLYSNNQYIIQEFKGNQVAKYKNYYVNYLSLFNNVLIVKSSELIDFKRNLMRIPIIQKYVNTKYYTLKDKDTKLYIILYETFYFYIPIFLLLNIILLILLKIKKYNQER